MSQKIWIVVPASPRWGAWRGSRARPCGRNGCGDIDIGAYLAETRVGDPATDVRKASRI